MTDFPSCFPVFRCNFLRAAIFCACQLASSKHLITLPPFFQILGIEATPPSKNL